jgi:beta-phosphoglucomutase-like phosphatase (HAD superfamily)
MASMIDPNRAIMRLPRAPAALVFDMDGLLFDTETLYQEAILLAAAEGGHEVAVEIFNSMVGVPWAQSDNFAIDEFQETWVRHFWVIAETPPCIEAGRARTARHAGSVAVASGHRNLIIPAYCRASSDGTQPYGAI